MTGEIDLPIMYTRQLPRTGEHEHRLRICRARRTR
jgi:hypothetical protein